MTKRRTPPAKDNGRPYTDCHDLIKAQVEREVEKSIRPASEELSRAVLDLKVLVPQFQKVDDRSFFNRIGLIVLAIICFVCFLLLL